MKSKNEGREYPTITPFTKPRNEKQVPAMEIRHEDANEIHRRFFELCICTCSRNPSEEEFTLKYFPRIKRLFTLIDLLMEVMKPRDRNGGLL